PALFPYTTLFRSEEGGAYSCSYIMGDSTTYPTSAYDDGYALGRTHVDSSHGYAPGTLDARYNPGCVFQYTMGYEDAFYNTGWQRWRMDGSGNLDRIPNECVAWTVGEYGFTLYTAVEGGRASAWKAHNLGVEWISPEYEELSMIPDFAENSFPASCDPYWEIGFNEQVFMGF